jgi:hypothetical protein
VLQESARLVGERKKHEQMYATMLGELGELQKLMTAQRAEAAQRQADAVAAKDAALRRLAALEAEKGSEKGDYLRMLEAARESEARLAAQVGVLRVPPVPRPAPPCGASKGVCAPRNLLPRVLSSTRPYPTPFCPTPFVARTRTRQVTELKAERLRRGEETVAALSALKAAVAGVFHDAQELNEQVSYHSRQYERLAIVVRELAGSAAAGRPLARPFEGYATEATAALQAFALKAQVMKETQQVLLAELDR